jgi:hypothetical protein
MTRVLDINEQGDIVRGQTRAFQTEGDALDYARDRIPVGEAFVVVAQWRGILATFGSKPALRNGGWL